MVSQFNTGAVIDTEADLFADMLKDEAFGDDFKKRLKVFLPKKRWYAAKDDEITDIFFDYVCPLNDAQNTYLCVLRVALEKAGEQLLSDLLSNLINDK